MMNELWSAKFKSLIFLKIQWFFLHISLNEILPLLKCSDVLNSSNLNFHDYLLFLKIKTQLLGRHIGTVRNVRQVVMNQFKSFQLKISITSCLNFWDKAWWFRTVVFIFIVIFTTFRPLCPPTNFRFFCRTKEPTWNFEPPPFFNLRGPLAQIPSTITRYKS